MTDESLRVVARDTRDDIETVRASMVHLNECITTLADITVADTNRLLGFATEPLVAELKKIYEQMGWLEFALLSDKDR